MRADNITRAFTVGMTVTAPHMKPFIKAFHPGQACEVFIGDDLILTGYIDQTPISYSATSMQAQIIGHSKTIDLVECTVAKQGQTIQDLTGINNAKWSVPKPPVPTGFQVVSPISKVTALSWRNVKMFDIIAQLIAPYGVRLLVNNDVMSADKLFTYHNVGMEKKVLDAISELVKEHDLWVCDNEYGDLVISKPGAGQSVAALVLGQNVLSGSITHDASKLYTVSEIAGTTAGTPQKSGKDVTQFNGVAEMKKNIKDKIGLTRYRYSRAGNDHADSTKCAKQAKSEMEYQTAQYFKASYTVQGWRQLPDVAGSPLWRVNNKVAVADPILYGNTTQSDLTISKVEYVLDNNGGMITNLDVVPVQGLIDNSKQSTAPSETKAGFKNKHKDLLAVVDTDKYDNLNWINAPSKNA